MVTSMEHYQHGSSRIATAKELEKLGYLNGAGTVFGYFGKEGDAITYAGDGHRTTCARARGGKGITQIIPEMMTHEGALLAIDPKGENAIITAEARERLHGQKVYLLDPYNIAAKKLGRDQARFNPLDLCDPESADFLDDIMQVSDALIVADGGDSHWGNEAKSVVSSLCVHVKTSPKEEGQRTLGRVREILSLPPAEFQALILDMAENGHHLAQAGANRIMQKSERELASVVSTAQQNTHFLESQNIKDSLSASDFDFAALKSDDNPITVLIILPANRLNTHGRWLRLIVSSGITAMARPTPKPQKDALFLLDEFAALGKLSIVEDAFGLMAGFGMTIHIILQDLSQLQSLYGQRWQTFIANAAVLQIFGTRDVLTAEYASKLAGMTTMETISEATQKKRDGGAFTAANPNAMGMNDRTFGRALFMPEEIMRLPSDSQLLFLPESQPILSYRVPYYANASFYRVGDDGAYVREFNQNPDYPEWTGEIGAYGPAGKAVMEQAKAARTKAEKPAKKGWFG